MQHNKSRRITIVSGSGKVHPRFSPRLRHELLQMSGHAQVVVDVSGDEIEVRGRGLVRMTKTVTVYEPWGIRQLRQTVTIVYRRRACIIHEGPVSDIWQTYLLATHVTRRRCGCQEVRLYKNGDALARAFTIDVRTDLVSAMVRWMMDNDDICPAEAQRLIDHAWWQSKKLGELVTAHSP